VLKRLGTEFFDLLERGVWLEQCVVNERGELRGRKRIHAEALVTM
jgi:hypothetical protein